MKSITIHVADPVYRDLESYAHSNDRTPSDVIREAVELHWGQYVRTQPSLRDIRPASVGKVLHPFSSRQGLLEEMLDG